MNNILLFDEEFLISKELKENFLLRDSEINFDSVQTYKDAIKSITENLYDIILIDIVIPFDKEDEKMNNQLTNNQKTGIVFKDKVLELIKLGEIKRKPRLFFFTARTNISKEDISDVEDIIIKPKRPSEIYKILINE